MTHRARTSLALVFVGIAAVCGRLGYWQLDRLHGRRAANAAAAARRALPPLEQPSTALADTSLVDRRVIASGRFDYDREIVIRGQSLDGVPGVHLVTPLRLAGGDLVVLVDRGFVPSPDALTLPQADALRPAGIARVEGITLPIERHGGAKPLTHGDRTSWARLDLDALRDSLPYPVPPIYIRRTATGSGAASGFPRALPPPSLDDGPHLNYAIQWCAFMVVALIFAGVTLWKAPDGDRARAAPE